MGSRLLPLSLALGAFTADAAGFHHIASYLVLLAVVGAAGAALVGVGGGLPGGGGGGVGARSRRLDDAGARSAPAGVSRPERRAGACPRARLRGVDPRPRRARLRPATPRVARRAGRAEGAAASSNRPVAALYVQPFDP